MHFDSDFSAIDRNLNNRLTGTTPMMTKQPTHAAIQVNDKLLVVPYCRMEIVLSSLTFDDLCGVYTGYCYSSSDARKLDPTKLSQELNVTLLCMNGVEDQKSTQLQNELDSANSSVEYYRRRATETETKLAELQKKVDALLGPKPDKADHGTDSL